MKFQFNVRTVLAVVTVLAISLGWGTNRIRVSRQSERTVTELRQLMAIAKFEDGSVSTSGLSGKLTFALRRRRITSVGNVTSDEALSKMSRLRELREVQIAGAVTDDGLSNLRDITSLTELRIHSDGVTASGLCLGALLRPITPPKKANVR